MKVVFRVDASLEMGTGHVMRCLTLANELKQQNHEIVFICRELTGNLILLIKYPVLVLPKNDNFQSDGLYLNWLGATQEQDAEQTIKVIPKNTDLLIVDSYALDEIWHKKLIPYTKKIMVIDDLADRQFDCDVLLNQNLGIQKENYKNKVPNNCELLLGCDYALLRLEFAELREKALEKRGKAKTIKNILISMGGSDVNNITYDILQNIDNSFNIVVVLGKKSPHNKMLENYAINKNIEVVIDANNMAELILDADLSIGAGGSTSWERCCLGLPTLLYIAADNQRLIAENLEKMGSVKIVKNLGKDLQVIVNNSSLWKSMSKNASTICDGLGANKVAKYLQ
jgi:UDP-2,4-diacetamido-2,4,6-trideoxy-beta-L-altropyranose hydrolase